MQEAEKDQLMLVMGEENRLLTVRVAELEAQVAAVQQGVQPVAWLAEYVDREGNSKWYVSTHKDLAAENDMHGAPKPLYTHPTQQGLDLQALHNDIMNLPCEKHSGLSYREGHRDARHAAAELVLAAQAKQGGV